MKNAISRFGKFLSGMVMPNIGAFIPWGFLTALFIEKGWFPNERLSSMVSPMLSYLLPILIAGQGGYMVAKERGRVIACIAVIGCICGSGYTMLMGAMVMLLSRWLPSGRLWTILIVLVGIAAYAGFALLTGAVQKSDLAPLLRRGKKGAE